MTQEQRMKLAAELTMQRRINEHARDRAKRELAFAESELLRVTDDFIRYVVSGWNDAQVDRNPKGHDAEERHGAKHESPVANGDAPQAQPQGGDA